jgi:CheY-like chemotaxis protein
MKPRILLVEDDPTTAAFLTAAAEALPADVDSVGSVAAALAQAPAHDYALWLVDAHLPDGEGATLLAELRAAGLRVPAIAHTASREAPVHDALHGAGFAAVLVKPLSATALRAALAGALGSMRAPRVSEAAHAAPIPGLQPPWDDAAALRALNGERAHVDALRVLFRDELPAARDLVATAVREGDGDALRGVLHRLRASCGFVGARRLEDAVVALQVSAAPADALDAFLDAAQDTLSTPP